MNIIIAQWNWYKSNSNTNKMFLLKSWYQGLKMVFESRLFHDVLQLMSLMTVQVGDLYHYCKLKLIYKLKWPLVSWWQAIMQRYMIYLTYIFNCSIWPFTNFFIMEWIYHSNMWWWAIVWLWERIMKYENLIRSLLEKHGQSTIPWKSISKNNRGQATWVRCKMSHRIHIEDD